MLRRQISVKYAFLVAFLFLVMFLLFLSLSNFDVGKCLNQPIENPTYMPMVCGDFVWVGFLLFMTTGILYVALKKASHPEVTDSERSPTPTGLPPQNPK